MRPAGGCPDADARRDADRAMFHAPSTEEDALSSPRLADEGARVSDRSRRDRLAISNGDASSRPASVTPGASGSSGADDGAAGIAAKTSAGFASFSSLSSLAFAFGFVFALAASSSASSASNSASAAARPPP